MRRNRTLLRIIKAIVYLILAFVFVASTGGKTPNRKEPLVNEDTPQITYNEYLTAIDDDTINTIYYEPSNDVFYAEKTDGTYVATQNPSYDTFRKDMLEKGITIQPITELGLELPNEENDTPVFLTIIHFVIIGWAFINLITVLCSIGESGGRGPRRMEPVGGGGGAIPKDGGHSNSLGHKKDPSIKTFDDVAGLYEVKKDVRCLVDFLQNKNKYVQAGAELPKGVIFYGPPGTGKTLLAKAIAGEAGVPFHYMSGSDFVELYVGMGAKRVRELFEKAKKDAPCIIFIDEIDSIGCKRNSNDMNGEDRKTLNALLTEMDGFKASDNVLVIGATNRIDDIDEALVRPGRFTNKFCIPLPETTKERIEIIRLYANNKKIADDVSFDDLAAETIGFSPAAIEALLNEAAIISVQDDKRFIDKMSIDKAMFKVVMSGHMKEDQSNRDKEELRLVAWHEAGHALVGKLNGKKIPKVTILSSTSGAGGATFTTPLKTGLMTYNDLKNEVKELYAGRIAELLLANNDREQITTGALNDIERATGIIRDMITAYGMDEQYGMLNLVKLKVRQDVIVEREVELAKQLEEETIKLLTEHREELKNLAERLLKDETIYDSDVTHIVTGDWKIDNA